MFRGKVSKIRNIIDRKPFLSFFALSFFAVLLFFSFPQIFGSRTKYIKGDELKKTVGVEESVVASANFSELKPIDKSAYDKKLIELANNPLPPQPTTKIVKDPKTGVEETFVIPAKVLPPNTWPVKTAYPSAGAILPFNRIIAYYGNLYSKKMGVLGQYPEEQMLAKLDAEVKKWEKADPDTPVIPALHYIAVVAQGSAGSDGKYRARMPDSEIDKVIKIAAKINAIVFLDIQVGFSTLQAEVPTLLKYLKMPQVHLGIDPEFSMKSGVVPGKAVGTLDAADINFTIAYLAKIVKENKLPPKVLVVHRYTQKMVTNYKLIKPTPEVQIVMHMDGWGGQAHKINTYLQYVYKEPVQFTGFKLFYKHDVLEEGSVLLSPTALLKLRPRPSYIQYQ